jgi:hypothetical protein
MVVPDVPALNCTRSLRTSLKAGEGRITGVVIKAARKKAEKSLRIFWEIKK